MSNEESRQGRSERHRLRVGLQRLRMSGVVCGPQRRATSRRPAEQSLQSLYIMGRKGHEHRKRRAVRDRCDASAPICRQSFSSGLFQPCCVVSNAFSQCIAGDRNHVAVNHIHCRRLAYRTYSLLKIATRTAFLVRVSYIAVLR